MVVNVEVEFCEERFPVSTGETLTLGREADLVIDDNPFLHRRFLAVSVRDGLCILGNLGDRLTATASDINGQMEAFLAPGASLPLVFETTRVSFAAGPTAYEFFVHNPGATVWTPARVEDSNGEATLGPTELTPSQRLLIIALAEPQLSGLDRLGSAAIPTSAAAAARLGWSMAKFNRKLDNVCQKLAKHGVRGLHGAPGALAADRRARLVEYAVATRLVTKDDLSHLDDAETSHAQG